MKTHTFDNAPAAQRSMSRRMVIGIILAMITVAPVAARADGVSVIQEVWDLMGSSNPNLVHLLDNQVLLSSAAEDAWNAARGSICDQLKNELGKPDEAGPAKTKGITLYDISCSMGTFSNFRMDMTGNVLNLHFSARGNYLEFTSTTPTIAGKYADPRMSVRYDLDASVEIPIPSTTGPINVRTARIKVQNASLDSHNFPADILSDIAAVVRFFGGPNFVALVEQHINTTQLSFANDINKALIPVNRILTASGAQYPGLVPVLDGGRKMLSLRMVPVMRQLYINVLNVQDHANVNPREQNQIFDVAQVHVGDTNLNATDVASRAFNQLVPMVGRIPIKIDIVRRVNRTRKILCGPGSNPYVQCPGDMPPGGNVTLAGPNVTPGTIVTLNLIYDTASHRFTGTANGSDRQAIAYDKLGAASVCFSVAENSPSTGSCVAVIQQPSATTFNSVLTQMGNRSLKPIPKPGATIELNPQPLPPKTGNNTKRDVRVELNPQPLPPGAKAPQNTATVQPH